MMSSPGSLRAALNHTTDGNFLKTAVEAMNVPGFRGALSSFLAQAGKSMQADADPAARHVEVGGTADAVGAATLARGDNDVKLTDLGDITVATGSALYRAGAHSPAGDTTQASADTFLDYGGFDFVFEYTATGNGSGATPAGDDLEWAGARTFVFALDVEGYEFAGTPQLREGKWHGHDGDWAFESHVAEVNSNADAWGDGAYVLTQTDAFTSSSYSHAGGSALAWME